MLPSGSLVFTADHTAPNPIRMRGLFPEIRFPEEIGGASSGGDSHHRGVSLLSRVRMRVSSGTPGSSRYIVGLSRTVIRVRVHRREWHRMRHRRHVEAFSSLDKKLGSEAAYFNFLLRKPREWAARYRIRKLEVTANKPPTKQKPSDFTSE